MKTSILALFILMTGTFARAATIERIYDCDQKHGTRRAEIFMEDHKFFICFSHGMPVMTDQCHDMVWSDHSTVHNGELEIDFQHGWMFEGDQKGGILWSERTSYMCDFVGHDDDHGGDQGGDQGHDHP